jgi:hypothetical protein
MHDENWPSILYEQMNVHMSLTQWFKVEKFFYPRIQHRCVSLWAEPTKGVSYCGLAIYIKKYLKAKKRIMKTQIFHHTKI